MPSFNTGLKDLRNSVSALSLSFFVAACGSTPSAPESVPATPATAKPTASAPQIVPAATAMATTTTMSASLAEIERQVNEYIKTSAMTPRHRIYIIDQDHLNTFASFGATSPSQKFYYYLKERGINLEFRDSSDAYRAIGGSYGPTSSNPQALAMSSTDSEGVKTDVCIIVPETADLSSRSLVERWVGKAGPRYLQAAVDPGSYMMALRVAWHEAWHCMDNVFVHAYKNIDSDNGFEFALGIHRAEMFADVAATLTMAARGDLDILMQTADSRAIHARWNGPKMMEDYSPVSDAEYYAGITYYNAPAHDALLTHIKTVGLERVKQYDFADIQRIAIGITREHALTPEQFRTTADYLKQGSSYLDKQKQKAAQGNEVAQRNVTFLNGFIARTDAAKARMTIETARPVPPFVDVVPPTIEEILKTTDGREKREVLSALETSAALAQRNGLTARQGIYHQIEDWRQQLHSSPVREVGLERKLYMAGILLISGYLDPLIEPQLQARAPKP